MYQPAGPAARDGQKSVAVGYNLGDPTDRVSPGGFIMRTAIVCGLAAWLASPWAVAAPRPKDPPKKDPPTLVGEWISEHADGRERYVFTSDGQFTYVLGPANTAKYTYTTDPRKVPAEIDLRPEGGGDVVPGIYKIEGDTLTACFTVAGAPRPTRFEKSDNPHVGMSIYKRLKTKD